MPQSQTSRERLQSLSHASADVEVRILTGLHTALKKTEVALVKAEAAVARRISKRRSASAPTSATSDTAATSAPQDVPKDSVEEASEESFPASDPPSFTGTWAS